MKVLQITTNEYCLNLIEPSFLNHVMFGDEGIPIVLSSYRSEEIMLEHFEKLKGEYINHDGVLLFVRHDKDLNRGAFKFLSKEDISKKFGNVINMKENKDGV